MRVNLTFFFYSRVHDSWLEGKSTCTSLFSAHSSSLALRKGHPEIRGSACCQAWTKLHSDFVGVEAFFSPTTCLKVKVDRGQQTMMQRAPSGNMLIKTKCLCFLLFSHAEDLAIHGCFCWHCWSTPFLSFIWAEPEGMLGYHPENSSWTLTKNIFWYCYRQTHLSSRYCCTTELAGCQLQPWNSRVVTKKLIERAAFSTAMRAHGEPVVSTIASHSTGLSERTWIPFRPGLGASSCNKFKPVSALFLQAAFEAQSLRIRWGEHPNVKVRVKEGSCSTRTTVWSWCSLQVDARILLLLLCVLMKCHSTLLW